MRFLKQSTSVDVKIGPFLDETDGKTAETGLSITQPDIRLAKNGGAWAQKNAAQTLTHEENGWYEVTLDATDTNTLGILMVAVHKAGALPVWIEFTVLPANVYDSIVGGSDNLQVDTIQVGGTTQTARDLGASILLSPGTGTGQVSLSSGAVTVGTNNDKTGYGLSAAAVQAVWDALTSALTTVGSIGKKLADWVLGSDNKVILSNNAHTGATVPTVTSVTNAVKIDAAFKKNTTYNSYTFLMVDDTDGKTPETGLTGISCTRSIDGAAFGACANVASEVGSGWYKIDLAAGDLNGDEIILRFTKAGVARNWEHKIRTNPT
jgi:hypothetical protein